MREWKSYVVDLALARTGGNVQEAAKLLGIGKTTLYRWLAERADRAEHAADSSVSPSVVQAWGP